MEEEIKKKCYCEDDRSSGRFINGHFESCPCFQPKEESWEEEFDKWSSRFINHDNYIFLKKETLLKFITKALQAERKRIRGVVEGMKEERCTFCSTNRLIVNGKRELKNDYSEICSKCYCWVDESANQSMNIDALIKAERKRIREVIEGMEKINRGMDAILPNLQDAGYNQALKDILNKIEK